MDTANAVRKSEEVPVRIRCVFESKIFHNATSKYCIVRMKTADRSVPEKARSNAPFPDSMIRFTAIGYELPFTSSVELVLEGKWVDGKYGLQLQVEQWQEIVPTTVEGVLNYLSSGLLKNIGTRTEEEIVSRFGVDSLRIIEEEPQRLLEVRGITEERLEEIKVSYGESRALRGIITLLSPFKLTPKAALKIYSHFGPASLDILKKSPYALCQIPGYGFLKVDAILRKNNCDYHDPQRIAGALFWTMENARSDGGHLFLERSKLTEEAGRLLNTNLLLSSQKVSKEEVSDALQELIDGESLIDEEDRIYHPKVYAQEESVAQVIARMLSEPSLPGNIQPILNQVKEALGLKLSPKQELAVLEVFRHNLSVITGSPGTGKTTVLKVILAVYARLYRNDSVMLLAPTGRASRRMAESTGFVNAKTMHTALGLFGEDSDEHGKGELPMLDARLIIVDECSMLDMWLAQKFFSRIQPGTRVVLVGDPDQLPSVGAGNVFQEIIHCGIVPVTVLDQIFRQSSGSFIAHNAKIINQGGTNLYYGEDFLFIGAKDQEETAAILMELYCQEVEVHGTEQVQILAPFRKRGEASADLLNQELREIINPFQSAEEELRIGASTYRRGDRVMQTKNTKQVSNGDLGFIRSVVPYGGVSALVDFGEGRQIRYDAEALGHLDLAYATTVHKSQGSEYDIVLIPILKSQSIILSRNLLYTAITRAKKRVVLVGQKAALFMAIHSVANVRRNTLLGERICRSHAARQPSGNPFLRLVGETLKRVS